jgi:hypothetical protein
MDTMHRNDGERVRSLSAGRGGILLIVMALVVALSSVAIAGCGEETATTTSGGEATTTAGSTPTGEPVVIGAILSATGPNSPLGEPERKVLEIWRTRSTPPAECWAGRSRS